MKESVTVLGVTIHNVTASEAIEAVDAFVSEGKPHKIIVANAAKLVKAQKDPELLDALRTSDLVTADGISIVFGARLFGVKLVERVTGSEHLLPLSCRLAAEKGYSVFLLGAGPGVADKAAAILERECPGLNVAGTHSPGYNVLRDERETECAVDAVRKASPDILFVALGTPKQEKWISRNLEKLGVPVCMGVGATLDFVAGVTRRPPAWVHDVGFAWLYRLLHEPARLWRRNLEGVVFMGLVLRERLLGRERGDRARQRASVK
ncbi:MAG: WecB/TagA/CpsF family glycosyltransferase [Candidatus Eiseniibacteriota bacterium]|nr:MAG: WecB/TagA/CpsF family glycosyltransferase [Candidatus Eisenbacteria bacterium]